MKLRPRVQALLIVALLGVVLYASLLGARLFEYSFALHNAVQEGDTAAVRLLLMTGVDPNLGDRATGLTPLDWAAEEGCGGLGVSVLDNARKWGRQDFVGLFESYQSVSEPESEIVETSHP